MKKNKSLIIILLILVVGVIGLTLAYFANTANIINEFKSKEYGTTVTEEFTSPENWLPGSTEPKTLIVTNSGQVDEAVRVSYTETWTSKNSNEEGDLSLTQNNNRAAIINLANVNDWTPVTENNKTYYYYNYKLAPQETTSTLLDSVTFNSAITNDGNCVTTNTATGKTVTCTSTGAGYDGATYKLTFTVETIQFDKYKEAWGTDVVIVNTSKPAPVVAQTGAQKLLSTATNDSSITSYNDENADKGKMFVFNHEATEQTDALTDYRYIGDSPDNFVYFNCTDDEDTDTCEVWRIIGVFSVDRTDPNNANQTITETRMKIVRGSDFTQVIAWDSSDINDWSNASLKIYLNGIYYDSLSETAQSQIEDAIYYLGGRAYDSTTRYGSTEDIYTWERGIEVYDNTRPTNLEEKIGLMYPSDMYMTYGKGIDTNCYNDPYYCYNGTPTTGWIHNTNKLEGTDNQQWTWFISPLNGLSNSAFSSDFGGNLHNFTYYTSVDSGGVRPVLYLKSSINIISGEGTEQNPYVLQ